MTAVRKNLSKGYAVMFNAKNQMIITEVKMLKEKTEIEKYLMEYRDSLAESVDKMAAKIEKMQSESCDLNHKIVEIENLLDSFLEEPIEE